MTMGHRDISGSLRPRQNSFAVRSASAARIVDTKMILAAVLSAKTGIRQSNSQVRGASSTRSGRIGRPSKIRAPVQVNP